MSQLAIALLLILLLACLLGLLRVRRRVTQLRGRLAAEQRISESANDAILLADATTGAILEANPAACERLGHDRQRLLQLRLPDLHPAELRSRSAVVIADVWERKGLVYSDLPFVTAAGARIEVEGMLLDREAALARSFGMLEGMRRDGHDVPLPVALLVDPEGILRNVTRPDDVTAYSSEPKIIQALQPRRGADRHPRRT